ncbi:MAG: YidC/Oxa1 family membrane protein insertase [Bacillota bacterium]|nr:YidC/Oxa1 family membrane protein insertase [Bacillota bacterium]
MFDFIAMPLGQILNFIYNTISFHNYGLAIIFFTLLIRLILLPLTIKQYHSIAKTQKLQPQIKEIQQRYKNDKEKLNMEMMKLYKENNANPAGGCLPMLIQMPILIALYWVISSPLKYMLSISKDIITKLSPLAAGAKIVVRSASPDIGIIMFFKSFGNNVPAKVSSIVTPHQISSIQHLNLDFLGINLGMNPSWDPKLLFGASTWHTYLPLMVIPILVAGTTFLQSKIMANLTKANGTGGASMQMQNSMMVIMPIMLLLFSFSVPAGLGLYWTIGNIVQIFTQIYINNTIMKKKEVQSN